MPLADPGTISKGYCGGPTAELIIPRHRHVVGEKPANTENAEVAPSLAIISRRLSNLSGENLRRLKVVASELLRAPSVRRTVRSQLTVNRKLFFSLFALACAAVGDGQVVVR